jgi:hypothetical protein
MSDLISFSICFFLIQLHNLHYYEGNLIELVLFILFGLVLLFLLEKLSLRLLGEKNKIINKNYFLYLIVFISFTFGIVTFFLN